MISFAAMDCYLYCLWFPDEQAWWAETLKDAIISLISGAVAAYITKHGVPRGKAHVCEEFNTF